MGQGRCGDTALPRVPDSYTNYLISALCDPEKVTSPRAPEDGGLSGQCWEREGGWYLVGWVQTRAEHRVLGTGKATEHPL